MRTGTLNLAMPAAQALDLATRDADRGGQLGVAGVVDGHGQSGLNLALMHALRETVAGIACGDVTHADAGYI